MVRKNEKKFHEELTVTIRECGGWGTKAQRQFIRGVPDVELKHPMAPLVKLEVKHEVYTKLPREVNINLTQLQRCRLREMQKANLSCGWAVFVTIDKTTYVVYDANPDVESVKLKPEIMNPWNKTNRKTILLQMLGQLTARQPYLLLGVQNMEISQTTRA